MTSFFFHKFTLTVELLAFHVIKTIVLKCPNQVEEAVTIAELLGVEEIQPGEDFESFAEKLKEDTGVDVSEMVTVAEKQVEQEVATGRFSNI